MAFSDGQLTFALVFAISFIVIIGILYRSDLKKLQTQKKNALRVLIFIILVLSLFYSLVKVLAS